MHKHKKWRYALKKLRRKELRTLEAQAREHEIIQQSDEDETQDVNDVNSNSSCHQMWLEAEARAKAEWLAKREREESERLKLEEEQRRISEEWEERQKREKEEAEERQLAAEEKKKKQADLLEQATAASGKSTGPWHNPTAPPGYCPPDEALRCPFFAKVGACRFGNRCSRYHDIPESSSTIMIPGMYMHFGLEQARSDDYDTDMSLEFEDSDMYQHFVNFYRDVLPELQAVGRVVQFKVCCNHEPHLRGNVYVQYQSEEEASQAFVKFNGRWYGGRRLNCEFRHIVKWKAAICGVFRRGKCPKGKNCNFLHVFRNPSNEFWEADQDRPVSRDQRRESSRHSNGARRSNSRERSHSRSDRSVSRNNKRQRRSRSSDRQHKHRVSESPSPMRSRSSTPSERASPDSRNDNYRDSRSQDDDRHHHHSRSRSRSHHRSHRSHSHSRDEKRKSKGHKKKKHSHNESVDETIAKSPLHDDVTDAIQQSDSPLTSLDEPNGGCVSNNDSSAAGWSTPESAGGETP